MGKEFRFAIMGKSRETGKRETFVADTKKEVEEIKKDLEDFNVKEGQFRIRRRKR